MIDELATRALREKSPEVLRTGLHKLLVDGESRWLEDGGALIAAMAPLHDCARRLDLDLRKFFAESAKEGPSSLAAIVREFGRRKVTPKAFDFAVLEMEAGPEYHVSVPSVDPDAEAKLLALDLVMQGKTRAEAESELRGQLDGADLATILDGLYPADPAARGRPA